jgi:hypothetical protein
MKGFDLIEDSYKKYANKRKRRCIKFTNYFCRCLFKKEVREIALREIDGEWPYPERAN